MTAIARLVDWKTVPAEIRRFAAPKQTSITSGRRYVVAGVSVYQSVTFLLILDDNGQPALVPSYLFSSAAGPVPSGWVCSLGLPGGPDVIIGPECFARDMGTYAAVVEREPEAIEALVQYIEESGEG